MDDEAADAALAGIVVFIGGRFLMDDLVGTRDASLDSQVRDVRA
jgi:hypothetical protein